MPRIPTSYLRVRSLSAIGEGETIDPAVYYGPGQEPILTVGDPIGPNAPIGYGWREGRVSNDRNLYLSSSSPFQVGGACDGRYFPPGEARTMDYTENGKWNADGVCIRDSDGLPSTVPPSVVKVAPPVTSTPTTPATVTEGDGFDLTQIAVWIGGGYLVGKLLKFW